ncbi:hypothetical protein [Pseudomonas sp. TNT3]|uniref:hypothetical protein n=1 Tax=Pseudomonas sp. TNT3 TaxID=2654097 RepID=UPI00139101AC|nr:hypothetical protein [Pseudomonas sp. TNT3]KAI2680255.1 hypothetical protein GBC55_017625 [Pseudomonas sp. TNT3]
MALDHAKRMLNLRPHLRFRVFDLASTTKIRVEREQLEIERPLLADLAAFCERRIYLDTVAHQRLLLADFCLSQPTEIDPDQTLKPSRGTSERSEHLEQFVRRISHTLPR